MLQRIQSIFLAITVLGLFVFLSTNTWTKDLTNGESITVNPYYITHIKGSLALVKKPIFYVATLAILALGFTIFTIFQYKNRVRQMLLVALNSLLMGVATAVTVYLIMKDATLLAEPTKQGEFGVGLWAIFVSLISNWLANRFIKADEKKVKAADRMR